MLEFPTYSAWVNDVLAPEDTAWWNFRRLEWHAHYRDKARIAAALAPTEVLEVGVRFGYSAHAILFGAQDSVRRYTGVDGNHPRFGGWMHPTLEQARTMLHRHFPGLPSMEFVEVDTHDTPVLVRGLLPPLLWDLVYVDADHSYEGALQDMETFWAMTSRVMWVDDYTAIESVRRAVDDFARAQRALVFTMPSLRGEALIFK